MVLTYGIDWADVADQFMWGEDILVAPVVQQSDNDARSRNVMLPPGVWFNFWTLDTINSTDLIPVQIPAPIDESPVFVRAGAILPLGPIKQFTAEKAADPLEVRIYPGADGKFSLYEDDGESAESTCLCITLLIVAGVEVDEVTPHNDIRPNDHDNCNGGHGKSKQ